MVFLVALMSPPSAHKLRSILSQSGWVKAAEILQRLDPAVAADALLDVPFDEQRELYRCLPIAFAASLTAEFPYYHAYVLLHARPLAEMNAILCRKLTAFATEISRFGCCNPSRRLVSNNSTSLTSHL